MGDVREQVNDMRWMNSLNPFKLISGEPEVEEVEKSFLRLVVQPLYSRSTAAVLLEYID